MSSHEGHSHEGQVQLIRLSELKDWHISEGDPDIRGWTIVDRDNYKIGSVVDLLINERSGTVPFAISDLGAIQGLEGEHSLIPLEMVKLDKDHKLIIFNGRIDDVRSGPRYTKDTTDHGRFFDYWDRLKGLVHGRRSEEFVEGHKHGETSYDTE